MFTYLIVFILLNINKFCVAKLPSDISLCKSEDTVCISNTITDILKKNPHGRPDLNLPPLDPLRLNSLILNPGSGGGLQLKLSFRNIDISGLSKTIVERVVGFTKDPRTSKFELYARTPKLNLKGLYKASGRVLVLPIQGEGDANIILENVKISVKFTPLMNVKNGKTFIDVNKFKLLLEPTKLSIKFENLFNGDKTLGDSMNKLLNEQWKSLWDDLSPSVNDAIIVLLKDLMRKVFQKFSYDEIYRTD